MRRLSCYILGCWLLCFSAAYPTSVISNFGEMKAQVRIETGMHDTSHLPDTTLRWFCNRALLWTSTDIGGKEEQLPLVTVAGKDFYLIGDSITQIVHATLVSNGKTFTIKAWYPEFFLDGFPTLEGKSFTEGFTDGQSPDETPMVYHYWADSLQLIPIPQKVDTIYLKVFLEYANDTTNAGSLQLKPAYIEAALSYATQLVFRKFHMYKEAAIYKAIYDDLKANLKATYTRKLNAPRSGN